MKGSSRVLVYCVNAAAVSSVVFGLAHCGGGERPLASEELPFDAGTPVDTGPAVSTSAVSILGFDPAKGLLFGEDGFVDCGKQAPDKVLTLQNSLRDTVKFTAKLTSGSDKFKITPAEGGVVPSKGETSIQITANPIPQDSDVTPDLYAGTLEVQFATGEPPTVIRLHQTASGAIITSTLTNGIFGDVKVETTFTQSFSLTNAGNRPATANFALGSDEIFKISDAQTATVELAPGASATKTITVKPKQVQTYDESLALSFNTSAVHCKKPPTSTALKATGTTAVTVTPGVIDYGLVACNKTYAAGYQLVSVSTAAAMTFTPVLVKGETGISPYTLANDTNGGVVTAGVPIALAAGGVYKIRVLPKPVPSVSTTAPNGITDTLRITTDVVGDQPHLTVLNETASGARFEPFNPPSLSISIDSEGFLKSTQFQIINTGNLAANYLLSVTPDDPSLTVPPKYEGPGTMFALNLTSGTLQPATQATVVTLDTRGPKSGQVTAKIDLQAGPGAVMCADLPGKMTVSLVHP